MNESSEIPDTERGLYHKFNISRVDEEAQKRHQNCFNFVLDLDHDEFAETALWAYTNACQYKYPQLADDIHVAISANRAKKMLEEAKAEAYMLHPEEQAEEDFLREMGE